MKAIALLLTLGLTAVTLRAQPLPFFPDELVVTASALKLRDRPDQTGRVLETLPKGAVVQCLGAADNGAYGQVDSLYAPWYQVRSAANKTGYVFGAFVSNTFELLFENQYSNGLPALNYYGIYRRDSFADELRPVQLRVVPEWNEMFGTEVQVVKTDQKEESKLLFGSLTPLQPGFAGNLGIYDPGIFYGGAALAPGNMVAIYPGNDVSDTLAKPTWYLAATGCADLIDHFPMVRNFQITLIENAYGIPGIRQNLTEWFLTEEGLNPSVNLLWFGDADRDNKPDCLISDCPQEVGCRASLFLSSRARPGELLRKVAEFYYPYD